MEHKKYNAINQPVRKKDSMQLLLGKPVYVEDIAPKDALTIKLLRSPHANAIVEEINVSVAKKVPGVVDIYTWEDVPKQRFAIAGQTYPEPSPYDRLILDRHVRFVGDVVAIIAAENEKAALKAMKLIKVNYKILEPVLDFHQAKDNEILVHPEEDWLAQVPVGGDARRNLVASEISGDGDVDAVLADCDEVLEHAYHMRSFNQAMMETFRTYTELDRYGRLHVISSTQIVFHVRRILSRALGIPKSKIRVEKPRIGGGFGAKQTAVSEVYPAFVTLKTGRPAQLIFTREESQIAGSPRHEMEVRVRLGADKDGRIRGLDLYTLSKTGAYGEHGPTTVGLSGHKSIPLYTGGLEAYRFNYDVVYTNTMAAGAYRGYGATQGIFALETAVNELAEKLGIDPTLIREKNMLREGMKMPAYYGETANACALDKCMARCKELFHWDEKYPVRDMGNGKVRAAGVAMAMQGSCISNVDVGSATVKLADDGTFNLIIGAADMGTGCSMIIGLATTVSTDIIGKIPGVSLNDRQKHILNKVIVVLSSLVTYLIATQMGAILSAMQKALSLAIGTSFIVIGGLLCPKFSSRKAGFWTIMASIVSIVAWNMVPALVPVFKNVGFFMLAVCGAVFILISLVDPEKVKQ